MQKDQLQIKIREISDDIELCRKLADMDDNESWKAYKTKIEEGIKFKENVILTINPDEIQDKIEFLRRSLIEINVLKDVLGISELYKKKTEEKVSILETLKRQLEKITNRKTSKQRIKYDKRI